MCGGHWEKVTRKLSDYSIISSFSTRAKKQSSRCANTSYTKSTIAEGYIGGEFRDRETPYSHQVEPGSRLARALPI